MSCFYNQGFIILAIIDKNQQKCQYDAKRKEGIYVTTISNPTSKKRAYPYTSWIIEHLPPIPPPLSWMQLGPILLRNGRQPSAIPAYSA